MSLIVVLLDEIEEIIAKYDPEWTPGLDEDGTPWDEGHCHDTYDRGHLDGEHFLANQIRLALRKRGE